MNAMTNFTLRSLRANKVRTLVTVAGVALAAALLTAVLTTYTSLTNFLYRTEAYTSGTWMAYVEHDSDDPAFDAEVARAKDDPVVTGMATLTDVGFVQLTEAQQNTMGIYMPIVSAAGEAETIAGVRASEGRMPENADEILLNRAWQTFEEVNLGDTITFNVGRREVVRAEGFEDSDVGMASSSAIPVGTLDLDPEAIDIVEGMELNSSMSYFNADRNGGYFDEHLVGLHERTYTVVGFYDRVGYGMSTGTGTIAVTADDPEAAGYIEVFLTMEGLTTAKEVQAEAKRLFPNDHVVQHVAMLRYMGISSETSLWDTFFGLVTILASVIAIACVSLIFNAFNISVAERVSQFGLLSSVGASRRQLRRAVVLEGLLVAVAGVPLGLLVGLAGCAVTFAFLGPSIAQLAGGGAVDFVVAPSAWALGVAAVLTLVTVLVSVWIPAKRASRTHIIDALRHVGGSRASKKGARDAAKSARLGRLWTRRGLSGRVFGVGGTLARVNRKRGATKGRAAAVSLALAIVLLMTAGSLNVFLGALVGAVTYGGTIPGEVSVTAGFMSESEYAAPNLGAAQEQAVQAAADGTLTPELQWAAACERFAAEAATFAGAYDYLDTLPNAQGKGWALFTNTAMTLPASMVGSALRETDEMNGGLMADGRYGVMGSIVYIDDASFDTYARGLGLDPADFRTGDCARAIGLARAYGNNGNVYQLLEVLSAPGTAEAVASVVYDGSMAADLTLSYSFDGEGNFLFEPYVRGSNDSSMAPGELDSNDVQTLWEPIEVVTLAEEAPELLGGDSREVRLILPMSAASQYSYGEYGPAFQSFFDSVDGDHEALTAELATRGSEYFHDCDFEPSYYSYYDYLEELDSTQMIATVVNVFCLLFTVILALIAMANVFNTVTNSLILRRREFAVMKSVGLSNRQFRRMIMDECTSFGLAGLVPGLVISTGVAYLVYRTITQSMSGMPFTLPWTYVGLAVGMTAAAMAIAVAYGMHRCKADNIVEALRMESV